MLLRSTLQYLGVALALSRCVIAGAQTAPTAPASASDRTESACEAMTFERSNTISVPPGAKVPPKGVVVRVLLEYEDIGADPAVSVSFNSGDQTFADAVIEEAKTYRFSCVKKGKSPLRYMQEVQFVPAEVPKVIAGRVRPVADATGLALNAGCFKSADGKLMSTGIPQWGGTVKGSNISRPKPAEASRGVVIVAITFRGPDVAPEATILFSRGDKRFEGAVIDHVAGYRWSCMKAGDPPFKTTRAFSYVLGGEEQVPNKLTLQQFLPAVDKLTEQKVRFDFTTMTCPFEIRLTYLQPFTRNDVKEVGGANLNRREFVSWLREVTLKPELNPDNKLVDRELEVSVPCLVLDLL